MDDSERNTFTGQLKELLKRTEYERDVWHAQALDAYTDVAHFRAVADDARQRVDELRAALDRTRDELREALEGKARALLASLHDDERLFVNSDGPSGAS